MSDRGRDRDRDRDRDHGRDRKSRDGTRRRDDDHRSRSRHKRVRTQTPPIRSDFFNRIDSTLNTILSRIDILENGSTNSSNINRPVGNVSANDNCSNSLRTEDIPCTPRTQYYESPPVFVNNLNTGNGNNLNVNPEDIHSNNKNNATFQPARNNEPAPSASNQELVDAIKTLQTTRSRDYFVSNFDPSIHDIDTWCQEVERAKLVNGWNDYECLSRVANCLKGDARSWLNEWTSNDRGWRNFVQEFKTLCPRKLDYANILYDVMSTNSDKYATYAEYARRTLMRLRIVKGISEELMILIIIRGITDPQVRAAAVNANLTSDSLISFMSLYVKPSSHKKQDMRVPIVKKRPANFNDAQSSNKIKCFICGQTGHKSYQCNKKPKLDSKSNPKVNTDTNSSTNTCTFCKKPGHTEQTCFLKDRSEPRNKRKVNLCAQSVPKSNSNLTAAVIQGIPVDVLIDSGAIDVSLISSDVLKHFAYELKPTICPIKGIGTQEIVANTYVTLTIEFSDISLEADFVIVPASCMNVPILVGTDILDREGVTYVRTKDRNYLTRSEVTLSRNVGAVAIEQIPIDTPLQGHERDSLLAVLNEYSDYLITGTATTTVKTGKMKINLNDDTPVAYRPYKLSHQEKLKVREMISDLKEKGIIRESQSQYSSPIILVKKKDGSDRMCVDYRALNRLTVRDRYPMPLIDDHIDRLGKFNFFSSLDMATGFYQIPIDEDSIHKTGFVTPEGHYEFVKMPFGLTNSPIVYQRIINETLREFIEAGTVLVYVDDVLLMSSTIEEGVDLLKRVLKTLTDAGFSLNLRKCSFLTREVEYLGRVVSQGQVKPSPRKVEALVNSTPPTNVKQVRQFLGLAGYFRRYIEGYATKTACISRLTKRNVAFYWGPEQEKVRQELITRLTGEPVLAIFDPELPTEVHADASSIGYGAVLLQTHKDNSKRVVAYFSKSTQGAESRYHSYELETLAVVRALQHFRHYLVGLKFKLVTDCNALKATERKKDLLPRVARWWVYLQDFCFEIEYRKGTQMSHADFLSRNPTAEVHNIVRPRNWAQTAQAADNETQDMVQQLQEGRLDPNRYVYQNDLLYYRYSPVGEESRLLCFIPKGHRLSLLRIFHDEHGHVGAEKTLDLILKHFWFPGLRQFVAKYIGHCLICISRKRVPRAPHQYISSWQKPEVPFETIHADVLGPLPVSNGHKFVLLVVDAFSKYCLLYPMARQDAEELKQAISNAFSLFGIPKLLVADRGRMFEARSFVTWLHDMGCEIHHITPEMHQSNGQVERYVRTLLNMIRIQAENKNTTWADTLWRLQLVLNITKQKTTQTSPLNLLVGIDGATPVIRSLIRDIAVGDTRPNRAAWREMCRTRASELLSRNRTQQDNYVNEKRRPARVFQVGDFVFVIKYSQSTGKLDAGMRGPYRVQRALPSGRYELKLLGGSYGKSTQAAAEYMVPWRGEWCPESCAAFFENEEEEEPSAGPSSAGMDLEQVPGSSMVSAPDARPGPPSAIESDDETTSNVTVTDLLASDDFEDLVN